LRILTRKGSKRIRNRKQGLPQSLNPARTDQIESKLINTDQYLVWNAPLRFAEELIWRFVEEEENRSGRWKGDGQIDP
jgi:hypothetical protein